MTTFVADSPLASDVVPSSNHDARRRAPDLLILHYTGMPTAEAALARLCDPASQVSAHYFVYEDGRILQLVPESRRAWHAGAGSWAGESDLNSGSIGIEIAHVGHDGGLPPYPEAQIEAVIGLSADIVRRHGILAPRVLGHSDTAPTRKEDPGELFPWDRLHAAGIGHWVEPAPIGDASPLTGWEAEEMRSGLVGYGYGLSADADAAETATFVTAFQRHFRPARVDGLSDASTLNTMRRVLAALPA